MRDLAGWLNLLSPYSMLRFAREIPWVERARELRWRGHLLMTGLAVGIAGIALTVAGVSLGLTVDQLRSQRDRDEHDL